MNCCGVCPDKIQSFGAMLIMILFHLTINFIRLTLERYSTKECVFSVEDTNIADCKITFEYQKNTDKEEEEFISLTNFQMLPIGKCIYFIVTEKLSTGYHYNFLMSAESANDEIVRYGFENVSSSGEFSFFFFLKI